VHKLIIFFVLDSKFDEIAFPPIHKMLYILVADVIDVQITAFKGVETVFVDEANESLRPTV
tara:strand:+ start:4213 stop:4395 length:183 start_codon:yes stop_codon:yes gene_type:complete